jgi:hypothetical protein
MGVTVLDECAQGQYNSCDRQTIADIADNNCKQAVEERSYAMRPENERTELAHTTLVIRFTETCRRFMSATEVIHDVTRPWLASGRAKEIIESSNAYAEEATEICTRLLNNLNVAQMWLKTESAALGEYGELCRQVMQTPGKYVGSRLQDLSEELLSLVAEGGRETADILRPFLDCPTQWWGIQMLNNTQHILEAVLKAVDCARWQIIKEFARLVTIFDDHYDPDSDEPREAWDRDFQALVTADVEDV